MKNVQIWWLSMLLLVLAVRGQQFIRTEVYGNSSYGLFYVKIYVGSPQTQLDLLIDTGSALTNIPCTACVSCGNQDKTSKTFNFMASFTSERIKCRSKDPICENRCKANGQFCQYEMSYLDGTQFIGNIIQDNFSFAEDSQPFIGYFGCIIYDNEINTLAQRGILGLAPNPSDSLLYKWLIQDPERGRQFSICLDGVNGGYIEYGKYPQPMEYNFVFKYTASFNGFRIKNINTLSIGKVVVAGAARFKGGIMVDTGSTASIIPEPEYSIVIEAIQEGCSRNCEKLQQSSSCFMVSANEDMNLFFRGLDTQFPSLSFDIDGQILTIKPSSYFQILDFPAEQKPPNKQFICALFRNDQKTKFKDFLLGQAFFLNKKINFNIQDKTVSIKQNVRCRYNPYKNIGDDHPKEIVDYLQNIVNYVRDYYIFGIALCLAIPAAVLYYFRKRIRRFMRNRRRQRNRAIKEKREQRRGRGRGNGRSGGNRNNNRRNYQRFNDENIKNNQQISQNVISEG